MTENRHVSVTALTRYLKKKLESDRHLQGVLVRGEISNFKGHSRGHLYLTLKDQGSRIQAVMFSSHNQNLLFNPENGMKVLIEADLSVYEPYGQYQLYIKNMQPDGIGNLYLAYEQLKKKLEEAGYFNPEHKKSMPVMPLEIGVITSPTGAAIRDILTTVKRRFPAARVTLFPVLVQGDYAAASIKKAIEQANRSGFLDVLIVGRGGGSIEELWAFNEEIVATAIYESSLPIVSAVGHETDFTIADFVADLRAATPTAAAELVVPAVSELKDRLKDKKNRLHYVLKHKIQAQKDRLRSMENAYAFKYPAQLMRQKEQDLDRMMERMTRAVQLKVKQEKNVNSKLKNRLLMQHPARTVRNLFIQRKSLEDRLNRSMDMAVNNKRRQFGASLNQLNALSPLSIMARGYSLSYTEDHQLIKSVGQVEPGDKVKIKIADGELDCQVWGIEED
jgi:exodeoxyribonuclease VII large subunit